MSSRRSLLLSAVALGVGAIGWRAFEAMRPARLVFEPIEEPPGFRRIALGNVSRGARFDPFIGLSSGTPPEAGLVSRAAVRADLCHALFRTDGREPGPVPAASFSDVRCPICRVQSRMLADLEAAEPDLIRITWHEWPIFGESSEFAARAAFAAGRQGRYVDAHLRMLRTPAVITWRYLEQMSDAMALDFDRLQADMASQEVTRALDTSRHLAALFGFVGTPALVIGRTVMNGGVSEPMLRQVLAAERDDGWAAVC